ncbi:biotin/lipoyl-containing protein [Sulfobacillus thermosulfidooxidans]|uniref:biotin/lipoyl-containing protein n=1 Tax=Sulfobacillus thermosulfidooxidans TaxID=28034 RepID=UPI0003F6B171|nr:biotin/lipoyl-containing protein [Sulfobacillus thermosulfidooxidans]
MSQVFACEFPDHLWFDVERDVWIESLPSGTLRIGMTDPAQTRAGKILHVRGRPGKSVKAGKNVATIESAKWVGPFPAPVDGTVVRVNEIVLKDPNMINRDPYGEGWVAELQPGDEWLSPHLIKGADVAAIYREKLQEEGITCMRCAPIEETMSDSDDAV